MFGRATITLGIGPHSSCNLILLRHVAYEGNLSTSTVGLNEGFWAPDIRSRWTPLVTTLSSEVSYDQHKLLFKRKDVLGRRTLRQL